MAITITVIVASVAILIIVIIAAFFTKKPIEYLEELESIADELSGIHESLDKLNLILLSQQQAQDTSNTQQQSQQQSYEYNYDYLTK